MENGLAKTSLEEWVECWNKYFEMEDYFAHISRLVDPWKTYTEQHYREMRRALVAFLGGDRAALDRFEADARKRARQIRQSLGRLGDPRWDPFLLMNPDATEEYVPDVIEIEGVVWPYQHTELSGLVYINFTGIPDPQEARSALESMVGHPVSMCAGCSRLFVRSGKNRRLCDGCKGAGQDEEPPRRKVFRRVYMAFQRRLEKGLSAEEAREALLQEKKYADLVKKWNFDMSGWKSE